MTGSKKTELALTRVRTAIARSMSRLRRGRPRHDTQLPLIPLPLRPDRPSLPNQRPIGDVHEASSR